MKIIITGGAGFIGSNFILYMLKKNPDCEILCIDMLTYAANISVIESLKDNKKFSFIKENICDRESMDKIFDNFKPTMVVNFAAESHVDRSLDNPEIFLRTNFMGVGSLLDTCVKHGNIRFHQISTDEVYGDLDFDESYEFTEGSVLKPSSPYSASKAAADMLVLSYARSYGLPVTISRSANNYGRYQHREKLIPKMITSAVNGDDLPVYGEGKNIREWVEVTDHCRAIELILKRGTLGEIYNIGGVQIRNIELVEKIHTLTNSKSKIVFVSDRPGHDRKYAIDSRKIRKLGYTESIEFDEGLNETIKWYK